MTPAERFESWVLPEIEVLFRVARSLTRDTGAAEDLVQDTLLRAYRAIDRFDGAYPRAWLLTILRNAHTNNHRRRRPELLDQRTDGTGHDPADPEVDVEAAAMAGTVDRRLSQALGELPPRFREVVVLVDVDGLSYAESAALLDVPVGTVMSRLHRARRRLREALADTGLEPRSAA
jgi:RNA polymerase sigma-70 factor, ECF subfamily